MAHGAIRTPERTEIERIVREVLAEMANVAASAAAGQINKRTSAGNELVLENKVVSVAELADRLSGVTRVVVPRGAIFTPAARDELRKRNIAIASRVSPLAGSATSHTLVVGMADTSYNPASLVQMFCSDRLKIERLPSVGLINIVDELCEHVSKGGTFGLLITEQSAAAICLANRYLGVRAVLGHSVLAVRDASSSVAANFLVIDPTGKGLFEMRQMVRTLTRYKQNECPPALRQKLG